MKFDLMVLAVNGISLKGELCDSMIAHYLLQPELKHGMDYLAEVYLNYQTIHYEDLVGGKGKKQLTLEQVELEKVCDYAAEDADITLRLWNILAEKIKERFSPKEIIINHVGVTCGATIGPGLCAAFYRGKPTSHNMAEEKAIISKIIEDKKSNDLLHIILKGGNFGTFTEGRERALRNKASRKLHTFRSFCKNAHFALRYAPGEWFWTMVQLVGGQLR
jgi:hypothetical protein